MDMRNAEAEAAPLMIEEGVRRRILAVLFTGVLMGALDIAIVGPALPAIQAEFALGATDLGWVFGAYVLANLLGAPVMAKLSDRRGRRSIYVLDVALFALGSLIVAAAPTFPLLLAGRAIQGLGAGGIFPVASAVIGDTFPVERRGGALGLIGAVFGLAFLIGPAIGGVILGAAGWRWLFIVNLPLAAIVAGAAWQLLPSARPAVKRPFDIAGTAVLMAWLLALSGLISSAGGAGDGREQIGAIDGVGASDQVGTSDAIGGADAIDAIDQIGAFTSLEGRSLLALAVLAALVIALPPLFVRLERRAPDPVLNVALFASRQIRIVALLALVVGIAEASVVFVPSLLVEAFAVTESRASYMLLPIVLAMALGAPLAGRALDRIGSRAIILAGAALLTAGLWSVSVIGGSVARFYAAGMIIGLGLSMLLGAPLRYIVLREAAPSERAAAQGALSLITNIGLLVGATLVGALAALRGGGLEGYTFAFQIIGGLALAAFITSIGLKGRAAERRGSTSLAVNDPT